MDPHPLHRIHRIAIPKRDASQAAGQNEESAGAAGAGRRIQKREEGDVTGRVDRGVAEGLEVLAVQPGRRVTGRGEGAKVVADLPKQTGADLAAGADHRGREGHGAAIA